MNKLVTISSVLALGLLNACDTESAYVSPEANLTIEMCKVVIPRVQTVSQSVKLVNSFYTPRGEPDVVRLRYEVMSGPNSGTNGTVRCFYIWEEDGPTISKIIRDDEEIDSGRLPQLNALAKRKTKPTS